MVELYRWNDIKDQFQDNLLLGNGASIAMHSDFAYSSLFRLASESGALNTNLRNIFNHFESTDFEFILKILAEANIINEMLEIEEDITSVSYSSIKTALIETIRGVHPSYASVEDYLITIASFMKDFKYVFSFNYDLLVYWAMLVGNDNYGLWFKDCFINDGYFEYDFRFLENPRPPATGATLVFYPHGCLSLATEPFGSEVKISSSDELYLLDSIINEWANGNYIPLFVSEGESEQKLNAIGRNRYLNTVYNSILSNLESSITIYGWSFGRRDNHILDAIGYSEINRIAVSVHTTSEDWETNCERIERKIHRIRNLRECEVLFFDSESPSCWIH